jgi:hypothetical protein
MQTLSQLPYLGLPMQGGERIRNLLNIEVVATLNMAFCELHHKKLCGDHEQTERECDRVQSAGHIPLYVQAS